MPKCLKCGNPLDSQSMYCDNCGSINNNTQICDRNKLFNNVKLDITKQCKSQRSGSLLKVKKNKNVRIFSNVIKLDCNACKQEKTMTPTKLYKMSPIVVFIGWILALPSIFGVLMAIILFVQAAKQIEASSSALGVGLGIGVSVSIGVFSLVGGLLGYLLIMKKKVYKCSVCGFIIDRA